MYVCIRLLCYGVQNRIIQICMYVDLLLHCMSHVLQDSIWVHVSDYGSVLSLRTVPTNYLSCTRQQATLLGCLVEFDHLERQCAEGRIGKWGCGGWWGWGKVLYHAW